jgi:hypothetical protein
VSTLLLLCFALYIHVCVRLAVCSAPYSWTPWPWQEVDEGPVGLVLESTSFYAEAGGQVADIGSIEGAAGAAFDVQDVAVSRGQPWA